ncbi:MAG: hypothetical protein AUG80_16300 [Candidatus Rokubacteria bacterium 13_1_20CM_4_68_9]|nr:MAG: hypothetical protein AUG80_16300 [Candidatus Rokubacteria bacterium 13_1_20CM_4_68_9]
MPSTALAMPADEPLRDMATVNRFGKSRPPEKNSSAVGITMSVRLSGTTSDRTSIDSGARIASRKALRTVSWCRRLLPRSARLTLLPANQATPIPRPIQP